MKDLTKGFPAKVIIMFALPLIIGNIAQSLYNITDSKIVSLYVGSNALAAVGATGVIVNLLVAFLNGLTQGFAIVTAKYFGAKKDKELRQSIAGTFLLVAVFSVALMIIGLVLSRPILVILNTPEEILEDAVSYIRIILSGLVFSAIFNMSANSLRAVGDSKRPLYCIFMSIIVNVVLDIIFTKNLHMGIKGAALATIISQALCALACILVMFIKTKSIIPRKNEIIISARGYAELINYGFAMAFMLCIVNLGTVILQSGINGLGTVVVTSHIAARRILDVMMVNVYTIGLAMTTYASQNYGAGRLDRIKQGVKHAIIMDTAISTVLIIFGFIFGRTLVSWIASSANPEILNNGEMYLRIGTVCFYALGPLFIFRCTLQGMGAKAIPLITSTMELCIKILSVLALVPWLKYLGIALTEPLSWIAMTIVLAIGYIKEIKKNEKIFGSASR